jgi:hypothetical protein
MTPRSDSGIAGSQRGGDDDGLYSVPHRDGKGVRSPADAL